MMVDSAALREQARCDYEKARAALQKARADLDRFNSQDKPACQRWVAATFGAALTELRDLHLKVEAADEFVEDVEDEFMFGEHRSIYGAYRAVKKEREQRLQDPETGEAAEEPEESAEESEEERAFREKFEEDAKRLFEDVFGLDPDDDMEDGPHSGASDRSVKEPQSGRLKELYRNLVRKLHPDAVGGSSPGQLDLWHQAQAAYENGDVDQLEVILATVEVEAGGTASASISMLKQIAEEFKAGLASMKRLLSQARRDPAWNFNGNKDREGLKQRFQRMFDEERQMLLVQLEELERMKAEWEAGPRRKGRGNSRRKRRQEEFEFGF